MKIALWVIFVHLALLAATLFFKPQLVQLAPRPPIAVSTHLVLPSPQEISTEPKPPQEIAALKPIHRTPQPTPRPLPTLRSRTTPKSHPTLPGPSTPEGSMKKFPRALAQHKSNLETQQKLIALAKQSLHKLDPSESISHDPPPSAQAIATLGSESLTFESGYEERLVAYLESLLQLPEKGEVKINLKIKREGIIDKLSIVTATSERNKTYIESTLPLLTFPPFGTQFKGETGHTFTLTLTSSYSK